MVEQQAYGSWVASDGLWLHEATVEVDRRDTFAEVALTRLNDISDGDGNRGQIGIIQIVSDSGTEDFDPVRQAIFRTNVTSIGSTWWWGLLHVHFAHSPQHRLHWRVRPAGRIRRLADIRGGVCPRRRRPLR